MSLWHTRASRIFRMAIILLLCASIGGAGATAALAADSDALFNTTLPLPEFNAAHLEKIIRNTRRTAGKPATTSESKTDTMTAADQKSQPVSFIISAPPEEPKPELRQAISSNNDSQVKVETQVISAPPSVAAEQPTVKEPVQSVAMAFASTAPTANAADFGKCPIIVDNDEATEQETTLEYVPLITDEAGTKAKAGARFPVLITSEITTKTAKPGDPVNGRLKFDLKIGNRVVAEKGSVVRGHVNYTLKARTPLASLVSVNRWYRTSGCLGIAFDEIVNEKGEHIPVKAEPAKTARYVKNKAEGRELGINHKGQIAGPWSTQLKYKAIRIGINAAMSPLGPMTFGAMPLALGVLGAANPSFAFAKPVGTNVRHRRIKGFVWGALSGVPGSWLIEDTTIKGQEACIKPGDEFYAEITQEFTGEPATDAEMLGGAETKVRGEVVDIDGKGTKKLKK